MKRGLMITGGPLDLSFAEKFLKDRKYDVVIAVDAGFSACQKLGIHPDFLVGDFDTFGRDKIQSYLEDASYKIDIHQPEKDETDTELAFRDAKACGCTHIDVLGALGGRIDHEISNIHLMVHEKKRGLQVRYYDPKNCMYILDAGLEQEHFFVKDQLYGTYVSFLPITEKVNGMTLTGFRYPLEKKNISILENPSLCVSNEVLDEHAVIRFEDGILLCVESRD